ncbi:MAG: conjugal transfer protein TraF [Vicinamibacterales bacterium]
MHLPLWTILLLAVGRVAGAQLVFESAGERALGMAGAFVAVADDATATHWNPAGLSIGGPAGMTIGTSRFQNGDQKGLPKAGLLRRTGTLTSIGAWPLGVSYGHFQVTTLTGGEGQGDVVTAQTFRTSQYGVTILQTVLPGVVVGSTVKLLRGEALSEPAQGGSAEAALKSGARLRGDRETALDLDLGVMATAARVRLGLTVKNLRSPKFGELAAPNGLLPRQGRVGIAVIPANGLTLAMDVDLNTVDLMGGLRRMGAFGAEAALGSRLSARSGIRWSLVGSRRPVGAVGLSLAVRRGLWLDGHYAKGRLDEDRELGVALRAGF